EEGGSGRAGVDAESLIMRVLEQDRASVYANPELELACGELNRYNDGLGRRAGGEPLQYITGHQEFWGLDLLVTPAVLIPRPETEHVVETVLELVKQYAAEPPGKLRLIDVGTGSGAIALSLASELPQTEMHACDISEEALEMARVNAA